MKTFPVAYAAMIAQKTGLTPIWILKIVSNGVSYYLSDTSVYCPAFGSQLKPWIKHWGAIQEGITGAVDEFQISDFSVELFVDENSTPNMATLIEENIEEQPASLYLWLLGCSDPPQEFFRGYTREAKAPSPTSVLISFQDETLRLERMTIGRIADTTSYPYIDPDDVGKVIPIVYGTVEKLPCLAIDAGIITTLTANITAAATSLTVSDKGTSLNGKTLMIDNEDALVTAAPNNTLTVTRARNSTTAVAHSKGAKVVEKKTSFIYMLADHPVDSISKVWARVDGVDVDITASVTRYTGKTGSQHPTYPNKAIIVASAFIRMPAQVSIAASDPGHLHTVNSQDLHQYATGVNMEAVAVGGMPPIAINNLSFPTYPGTLVQQNLHYEISFSNATIIIIDGDTVYNSSTPWSGWYTYNKTTTGTGNGTSVQVRGANGSTVKVTTNVCERDVTFNNSTTNNVAGVSVSGNSVANMMLADMILADVTRNISAPDAVATDILSQAGMAAATVSGTMPGGFTLNGAITESKSALEWLHKLAFQSQCVFRLSCGQPKLLVRPATLVSQKSIAACRIDERGNRILSREKTSPSQVINTVNLLYKRDWTKSGSGAYQGSVALSDSASITRYGKRENPSLFQFDFVTSATMASTLATFYLGLLSVQKWRVAFALYLNNADLEFGDVVTLGFLANALGQISEAGVSPGDRDTIDDIRLTVTI